MLAMASVAILLLSLVSPSGAAAPNPPVRREAVVVKTVENMYSAPSFDKDVASQAYLGQVVAVLETKGSFAKIETPDRYQGWVPASALKSYASKTAPRYATKGRVAEVVSLLAHVYREPDLTTYRPKAKAPLRQTRASSSPPTSAATASCCGRGFGK